MKYIEYINKRNALNYLCNIAYERGLSINTIVDGIADKGNVSRMRSGKAKITLDIIMLLANRLDVNLDDVLRNSSSTSPDFFEAIDSIRYYSQIQDFEACKYLLEKTEKEFAEEILKSVEIYQIIGWHKAIINIELKNNYHESIDILNDSLAINSKQFNINNFDPKIFTDIELGIINAIIICNIKLNNYSIVIKNAYEKIIDNIDLITINDSEIAFNIYYEFLITGIKLGVDRKELLTLAKDTAQIALDNGLTSKLPFIYYQIALLHVGLQQYDKAEEYFNSAIFMFKQIKTPDPIINSVIEVKHKCLERK